MRGCWAGHFSHDGGYGRAGAKCGAFGGSLFLVALAGGAVAERVAGRADPAVSLGCCQPRYIDVVAAQQAELTWMSANQQSARRGSVSNGGRRRLSVYLSVTAVRVCVVCRQYFFLHPRFRLPGSALAVHTSSSSIGRVVLHLNEPHRTRPSNREDKRR